LFAVAMITRGQWDNDYSDDDWELPDYPDDDWDCPEDEPFADLQ
jgi:hypothetical protein